MKPIDKILIAMKSAKFVPLKTHPAYHAFLGAEGENALIADIDDKTVLLMDENGIEMYTYPDETSDDFEPDVLSLRFGEIQEGY